MEGNWKHLYTNIYMELKKFVILVIGEKITQ